MAREADVACRTRTDATRHARPRGRAYEAHATRRWRVGGVGGADTWQEATRMPVRGTTWEGGLHVKGPRVSGPWLECWDGNAKTIPRSTFYTRNSLFFYSPWDYVPVKSLFCRRRGVITSVGYDREASIAWTHVHAIAIKARASKKV